MYNLVLIEKLQGSRKIDQNVHFRIEGERSTMALDKLRQSRHIPHKIHKKTVSILKLILYTMIILH